MAISGILLKSLSLLLRTIQFGSCAVILGIFSYFLAVLSNHSLFIPTWIRAVEGISGAGVLYTIFGLLLVCCLGGIAFFSILGMLLDLAFTGALAYVAWATRGGANSCNGFVNTPLGRGDTRTSNVVASGKGNFKGLPSLRTACKLETATFAVAIIACVFFFLSIFVELALMRHHRKEKAFGPSPNNGYTAGSPRRKFWQRKPKKNHGLAAEKYNPDALPVHAAPADVRDSYTTENTAVGSELPVNKYGNTAGYGNAHAHAAGYGNPAATTYGHNGVGGNGYDGYQTTTTTTVPHDGYTRTHQPYNANPTGTF